MGHLSSNRQMNCAYIVANKKTYLLISALNCKDDNIISAIKDWAKKKVFDRDEKIKEITEIYNKLGLKNITMEKIRFYFETGFKSLNRMSVQDNRKDNLRQFAEKLIERIE